METETLTNQELTSVECMDMEGVKSHNDTLVSVYCATYNHVTFIRQCLEGFVMQKTSFPFEVLIHDDASTDGTQDIVREYAARYPDIIKPIYQKENQFSRGVKIYLTYVFPRVKGKYIAMCEGDDYWTDPYKLQKQVDFLESHPDYVMCSSRFDKYWQESGLLEEDPDKKFKGADYDLQNLIGGKWLTQTLTVMYRRSALDLKRYEQYGMSLDMILFYELLKHGKGYCFPEVMGVYRYHEGGVWSEVSQNHRRLTEFKARLAIYRVEQNEMAARFILYQFAKAMSRMWMLQQWRLMMNVWGILKKHYGRGFVAKLMFDKLVLNKNVEWKKISGIKMVS